MSLIDDLKSETDAVVRKQWERRDGEKIPESEDIALGNECVDLEATFLYADLVDSTELAIESQDIAAEVVKAYLMGTTRIIRDVGGDIRSFDGDRVMGVFFGKRKNTVAGEAALKINYFFTQILVPAFTQFYTARTFSLSQAVGVDTSKVMTVRSGIRNNNDLVWVGRAPNVAAKLSALRDGYSSHLSESVFDMMNDYSKTSTLPPTPGRAMWESKSWEKGKAYGVGTVYVSNWWWTP
ncbi:MAG: adenylate/guanylate cyclase domain-containing protein [Candidatus Sulfotelmatobacter sp.]